MYIDLVDVRAHSRCVLFWLCVLFRHTQTHNQSRSVTAAAWTTQPPVGTTITGIAIRTWLPEPRHAEHFDLQLYESVKTNSSRACFHLSHRVATCSLAVSSLRNLCSTLDPPQPVTAVSKWSLKYCDVCVKWTLNSCWTLRQTVIQTRGELVTDSRRLGFLGGLVDCVWVCSLSACLSTVVAPLCCYFWRLTRFPWSCASGCVIVSHAKCWLFCRYFLRHSNSWFGRRV